MNFLSDYPGPHFVAFLRCVSVAAVFQILRGSEMLFAALFAVLFLKRRLNRWHFAGVALCMVGQQQT
jgi:drug/metabolite transporter (DMT)-like permease